MIIIYIIQYYLYLGHIATCMPNGHDIEHDTADMSSEYECLQCGVVVPAETHPGTCSACGGDFQNRAKSLE